MHELIINDEYSGRRLDRVVKLLYPTISKTLIFKLIRKKNILVNGKKTSANYLLLNGDILRLPDFNVDLEQKKVITNSKKYELDILYEDDDLLVLDKESGVAVQPGSNIKISLIEMVSLRYDQKIYPVHRLDKGTSGCIIFAKNYPSARKLSDKLHEQDIQKYYLAGIDGIWRTAIRTIKNTDPVIKGHKLFNYFDGKEAITSICGYEAYDHLSVLKLNPKTGRKHQLRLHLAMCGCPILGDNRYGDFALNKRLKVNRLMLHADKIIFLHPRTHKKLEIESKLTKIFIENIKLLDKIV